MVLGKKAKAIIIFIITFIPAFFIVGYIKANNVQTDWVAGTTALQKLPNYIRLYKINFWGITLWATIAALIPAFLSTIRTKSYE